VRGNVSRAAQIAEELLAAALPRRRQHVQAVAAKASQVGSAVAAEEADLLTAAAWLHDIGYAPDVTDTGPARARRCPLAAT
jgi:HD superfamily phosphodiesterase